MRKVTWKVEILIHETEETDKKQVYHFANEGLARLAIEWAYIIHLEALRERTDVECIKEGPDRCMDEYLDKKVTWWKKHPKGFVAMKDYFTATRKVYSLPACVGEAA